MRKSNLLLFGIIFIFLFGVNTNAQVLTDGGFEDQSSATLGDPWWIESDGNATIEVELDAGEAIEGFNNVKIVTTDEAAGEWIAIGQDLAVEPNTDYIITCYIKADKNIFWSGTPEWAKGYMGVTDADDNSLADPTIAHYWDGQDSPGSPWAAGEIVFGGGFDMNVWRDYHYIFNSGDNTELYLFIGTYVDNIVTWRVDGFSIAKLVSSDILVDGGFEDQMSSELGDPWWTDIGGNGSIEVEIDAGEALEGANNVKVVTTDNAGGDWIALGQDLTVEENTDYVLVFHLVSDNAILWSGNPLDSKGYMAVDANDENLGSWEVPHYSDNHSSGEPWQPGEIVFGEGLMVQYWRDYIYPFNSYGNTEVTFWIGTYVDNVVTWRLDYVSVYKALDPATNIDKEPEFTISKYALDQNYPNPFNPTTTITFSLEKNEMVQLKVYDLAGREIKTIVNEARTAGQNTAFWNGTDNTGQIVPTGVYFYQLQAGAFSETRKMMFLK